jgi:integrase
MRKKQNKKRSVRGKSTSQAGKYSGLTSGVIRTLPTPASGNKVYYDSEVAGFGLRVTANDARSFVMNYRTVAGRERRATIGGYPDWTATDARKEAQRLRRVVDAGGDPLADVEAIRKAPTMNDLCDRFEAEHLARKRPGTRADYKRMLKGWIRPHFGNHTKVSDVAFSDIDSLHRKISKAGHERRANTVVAVLSKMFTLAIKWQMRDSNPCKGIEKNGEVKRARYMIGDELARLTKALAEHPSKQTADIIRLLLLTGARRGEVLSMRWADVDLKDGVWSKPASSTKQAQNHIVPLSAPARQLLAKIAEQQKVLGSSGATSKLGTYVFPGNGDAGHVAEIKRAWRSICKAAGITGLRIHDLRHSFASQLASSGSSLPLIGALLGHSSVITTSRYAHLFSDPQRAAVERVGAVIAAGGKPASKPTPIRKGLAHDR